MVKKRIFSGILLLVLVFSFVGSVHAQITPEPTFAPGVSVWQFDPVTTEVGKRAERARQFVNWILTHPSIDNHAVFRQVWLVSSGVTFFLILLTVILMGIGVLVARKRDISIKVDITPILWKVVVLLVYTAFSYWIVLGLIQASDILMQFFIKLLNADKLFRIFFAASSEDGYRNFVGYRDFDPLKIEMVKTSWFLIDTSSYTYFVMGIVVVLRKIVLWFLLIVAPFLALLMPFRLIKNTGWIWIGVFFQWAFYGPLFALFLGALTMIWATGIPFRFNFWRIQHGTINADGTANRDDKVVYPLSINILYGGPQQAAPPALGAPLSATEGSINSSNYVDTFAEYVISLVMLWVVLILPWWLLRIFRDYCCEGIYAMKNILLNMLEQQGHGPTPGPVGPSAVPKQSFSQQRPVNTQQQIHEETRASAAMESMKDMKAMDVSEITRRMDIQIEKLSDIARFETQTDKREYVHEIMEKMRNPMAAESKEERSQFTKLKTEMSERAVKGDMNAQRFLNATTSTNASVRQAISTFAQSKAQTVSYIQNVSQNLNISQQDVRNITQSIVNEAVNNKQSISSIASNANISESQAAQVLQSIPRAVSESKSNEVVKSVATSAGVTTDKASTVLSKAAERVQTNEIAQQIAQKSNAKVEQVKRVAQEVLSKPIAQKVTTPAELIARPASMSIDEYEEIKKMWTDHYQKGEVPVSDVVKTRKDWVEKDIVSLNNTLNKLISDNEEVRAQGLQEVADVIPFFMLGNMSMQDIATYLKAKVSAASEIQTRMGEVEAVQQAVGEKVEEQFVDVEKQAEAVKEQTLKMEQEIGPTSSTTSVETSLGVNDRFDMGATVSNAQPVTVVMTQGIDKGQFESLLKKMDIQISKLSDIARAQTQIAQATSGGDQKAQEYSTFVSQSSEAVQEKIQQLSHQELSLMNTAQTIATEIKSSTTDVQRLVEQWASSVVSNTQLMSTLSDSTHVSTQEIGNILTTMAQISSTATPRDMLATISEKTNIEKEKVSSVVEKTQQIATSKEALLQLAQNEHSTVDKIKDIVERVNAAVISDKSSQPTVQEIGAKTNLDSRNVTQIVQEATATILRDQTVLQDLAEKTRQSSSEVQKVVQSFSELSKTVQLASLVSEIARTTQLAETPVTSVLDAVLKTLTSRDVLTTISQNTQSSSEKVQEVLKSFQQIIPISQTTAQLIAQDLGKKSEEMVSLMQAALTTISSDTKIIEAIAQSLQVPSAAVQRIAQAMPTIISAQTPAHVIPTLVQQTNNSKEVVEKVLEKLVEKTSEKTSNKEAQQAIQALSPRALDTRAKRPVGKDVGLKSKILDTSQMIASPKTMSIEEYEEIKRMWIEHYTNGEIPVTQEIKTRLDWVHHDSILLSNVLNKLVSTNEEIRAAGLSSVSDIIPFFMLTDMTIQDIAMYLKAKLAASQEVYDDLLKEEELKKMLEQKSEMFVEAPPTSPTASLGASNQQVQEMKIEEDKNKSS